MSGMDWLRRDGGEALMLTEPDIDAGGDLAVSRPLGQIEDEDASLMAAVRCGESDAVKELLLRHGARIFRLAQNITGNREDAEEVVQDAFHNAISRLHTFRGDARFSTWLTRIALNQALMSLRRRRQNLLSLDEFLGTDDGPLPCEVVDWGPNPEQRYGAQELGEILQAALAKLKADYRIVFQLRDLEEFSTEETAEALGISISTVKSRLLRARLMLRERLNRYFWPAGRSVRPTLATPALRAAGAD